MRIHLFFLPENGEAAVRGELLQQLERGRQFRLGPGPLARRRVETRRQRWWQRVGGRLGAPGVERGRVWCGW